MGISSLKRVVPELSDEELRCFMSLGWGDDSLLESPMLRMVVSLVVSFVVLICNDDGIAFVFVSGIEIGSSVVGSRVC